MPNQGSLRVEVYHEGPGAVAVQWPHTGRSATDLQFPLGAPLWQPTPGVATGLDSAYRLSAELLRIPGVVPNPSKNVHAVTLMVATVNRLPIGGGRVVPDRLKNHVLLNCGPQADRQHVADEALAAVLRYFAAQMGNEANLPEARPIGIVYQVSIPE